MVDADAEPLRFPTVQKVKGKAREFIGAVSISGTWAS